MAAIDAAAGGTSAKVRVIHGPNLDLLGLREPEIYGRTTLAELDEQLAAHGRSLGLLVDCHQVSGEGAFIDLIHGARTTRGALVINPGGYTHTSIAIADALRAVALPTVEVHLSNLYAREPQRHVSVTGAACMGVIMGLGVRSYLAALDQLAPVLLP